MTERNTKKPNVRFTSLLNYTSAMDFAQQERGNCFKQVICCSAVDPYAGDMIQQDRQKPLKVDSLNM